MTLIMFGVEASCFVILALCTAPHVSDLAIPFQSHAWVGLTLMLTLFSTVLAFLIMNTFQPRITATEAGLIYCVEPIFGSLMALFIPAWFSAWAQIDYANETANRNLLIGGALITAANLLLQLRPLPKE
jgi:drug/metabolite transporter (DMT)-like permease